MGGRIDNKFLIHITTACLMYAYGNNAFCADRTAAVISFRY